MAFCYRFAYDLADYGGWGWQHEGVCYYGGLLGRGGWGGLRGCLRGWDGLRDCLRGWSGLRVRSRGWGGLGELGSEREKLRGLRLRNFAVDLLKGNLGVINFILGKYLF